MRPPAARTPSLAALAAVAVLAAVLSLLSPAVSGAPVAPAPVAVHAATFQPPPAPGDPPWQSPPAPAAAVVPLAVALPLLVLVLLPSAGRPARALPFQSRRRRPARAPPAAR